MINLKTTENSIKLLTKDKYCDDDINVTFKGGSSGKLYRHDITLCIDIQDVIYITTSIYSSKATLTENEIYSIFTFNGYPYPCTISYYGQEDYDFNGSFFITKDYTSGGIAGLTATGTGYSPSAGDYYPMFLSLYDSNDITHIIIESHLGIYSENYQRADIYIDEFLTVEV